MSFQEIQAWTETWTETADEDESYEIDNKFITIFTRKFSTFVCTSCDNSCQATVMLFLLGNLEQRRENNDTLTKIKSFLCSDLYRIKDFRKVSTSDSYEV